MKFFSLATLALFAAWFLFALGPAQAADGGWSAERTKQYFEDMNDLHPNEGWDRAFDQLRVEQRDGPYDVKHIQNFRPISRKVTPQVGITNKDRYFQGIKIRSNY